MPALYSQLLLMYTMQAVCLEAHIGELLVISRILKGNCDNKLFSQHHWLLLKLW